MTTPERAAAKAEVESARAALVTHLNELEDAVNLPKRAVRAVSQGVRRAREFAQDKPAAAAAAGIAALAVVGGIIALVVRATSDD